ncbi:glycosyl transferase group 1 [Thalassoporum mexicanum PCC 7367]|uniref:glycosyltransferase family 4 protein n=1 Tax=Thalassoporum mexicanum TaxID=3457544 RepID=UPI00029F8EF7|nr:glycosyltransferase [Pseudanabaena sp. PCC 7367]AFY71622.1 glycosyl transferase group 1 [Pseudanabaena sp. PCC 7367]
MKVLISAYSCEPGRGSEPGVGWNVAVEAAKHNQVWVLTRPDESGDKIAAALAKEPIPNLQFVYFNLPLIGSLWRFGSTGAMQAHYYLWQIQAYFVAKRLHQEINFDVIHHVTFVKYSNPSFLALLDLPFVWGPVGGGESAPSTFWQDFGWRSRLYELARATVRSIGERDPFVKVTAQRSAAVRATTADTADRLHRMGINQVDILPEAGLASSDIDRLAEFTLPVATLDQPIRFISMGRLLHWKGFYLAVRAFAAANLTNAEYWLFGEGTDQPRLEAMATELGVADRIKFWGRQPRDLTLAHLGQCHVLVHPSLHDSGGWVCLEAMAAGRPVICLDLGGPAVQVTPATGCKIPAHNPEQVVQDMAAAMVKLANDPELRSQMGEAGKALIKSHHSWEIKGKELAQLYADVAKQYQAKSGQNAS